MLAPTGGPMTGAHYRLLRRAALRLEQLACSAARAPGRARSRTLQRPLPPSSKREGAPTPRSPPSNGPQSHSGSSGRDGRRTFSVLANDAQRLVDSLAALARGTRGRRDARGAPARLPLRHCSRPALHHLRRDGVGARWNVGAPGHRRASGRHARRGGPARCGSRSWSLQSLSSPR